MTNQRSIKELGLRPNTEGILNNANLTTIGQLTGKTELELLKYRNLGRGELSEIKKALAVHNCTLAKGE